MEGGNVFILHIVLKLQSKSYRASKAGISDLEPHFKGKGLDQEFELKMSITLDVPINCWDMSNYMLDLYRIS